MIIFEMMSYNSKNNCTSCLINCKATICIDIYVVFKPVFVSSLGRTPK